MDQMDVTTAYLNGELNEQIYVRPPKELAKDVNGKIWLLKKAMYGLKQSGKSWNAKLDGILKDMGLTVLSRSMHLFQPQTRKTVATGSLCGHVHFIQRPSDNRLNKENFWTKSSR